MAMHHNIDFITEEVLEVRILLNLQNRFFIRGGQLVFDGDRCYHQPDWLGWAAFFHIHDCVVSRLKGISWHIRRELIRAVLRLQAASEWEDKCHFPVI